MALCFRAYQSRLLKQYDELAAEFGFRVIDARRPVEVIQEDLRRQLGQFLSARDEEGQVQAPRPVVSPSPAQRPED